MIYSEIIRMSFRTIPKDVLLRSITDTDANYHLNRIVTAEIDMSKTCSGELLNDLIRVTSFYSEVAQNIKSCDVNNPDWSIVYSRILLIGVSLYLDRYHSKSNNGAVPPVLERSASDYYQYAMH